MTEKIVTVLQCGVRLASGHTYPLEVVEQAISKFNPRPFVFGKTRGLNDKLNSLIGLDNASHEVVGLRLNRKTGEVMATIRTLPLPKGQRLRELMDAGTVEFHLRSLINHDADQVVDHCVIVTVDACPRTTH
jgi:hypothetical protein